MNSIKAPFDNGLKEGVLAYDEWRLYFIGTHFNRRANDPGVLNDVEGFRACGGVTRIDAGGK